MNRADATLLVLQPRKMPLKALVRARDLAQAAGARLMGLVLNNVDISGDTQYQYYTTYYSYYSQEDRGETKKSKPVAEKKKVEPQQVAAADAETQDDLY